MKVLFVAGESVPFIKSGGLADVVGSLPYYLAKEGLDVRVFLPKYKEIAQDYKNQIKWLKSIYVLVGGKKVFCGIETLKIGKVTFYFIDNMQYFNRDGMYGYQDDGERFSFFCREVLETLPHLDYRPDVIHCHDWHSGMIPPLLDSFQGSPFYNGIKTIFTIHNLRFQGLFPKETLFTLGLDHSYYHYEKLEYYNNISFMKGGIVYSNFLTTVSPTYSLEIRSGFYGEGLDGLLTHYHHKMMGILNGIDYDIYNPEKDPLIHRNFTKEKIDLKNENKLHLQKVLSLPQREEVPLIGIVSRLTDQKGFDLIEHVINEIVDMDLQLVVLGTGDKKYEDMFTHLSEIYPDKVKAIIKFDLKLSHLIYSGSDMFLMPSLFEPCGLSQLIALRYGSIPIVRETGGLKDTIIPYNQYNGEGNGFSFANYNAHEMLFTLQRAMDLYYNNKDIWLNLINKAMESDYSWNSSAKEYIKIYKALSQ